jgi:hypothetical protein
VADRPHVRLVDAHAERVRRHDDRRVPGHKAPLRLGAGLAREPGVIGDRLDAELRREPRGEPLAVRPRARIDDAGQRARLGERGGDPAVDGRLGRAAHDREREVRAVEPRRDPDGVAQPEPRHDVCRHLRRGRRGRGDDRLRAEPARCVGEPEVVGPEVVPPLGHAVRLVDDEQADPRVPDPLEEARRGEPLRRDVQQPQVTPRGALERAPVGRRVLLGVDEPDVARRHPLDRLHLVLHQRDQRRHDEREVGPHQGGQLVAERLARARGHDHQHVAGRMGADYGLDGLPLPAPERLEPEQLVQRPLGIARARDRLGRWRAQPGERDIVDGQRHGRATIPAGPEGKSAVPQCCHARAAELARSARQLPH